MKFVILVCMVALVAARSVPFFEGAEVLRDDREVRADGYSFNLETSDGISRSEQGVALPESGALAQTGEIRFEFPDGRIFQLSFVADENGYRPTSEWLPSNQA